MRIRLAAVWTSLGITSLGALLFACDKVYADPVTTPFTPRSTTRDAGLTSTRTPPIPCSKKGPQENAPCSRPGSVCEYGESPDQKCNTLFVCASEPSYGFYWTEETPPSCAGTCPDPTTIVEGAPCDVQTDAGSGDEVELHCTTDTGTCACTTGADGAHAHARMWVCKKTDDGCPNKRPLLGQPCVGEHSCDYGACKFKRGARVICDQDVWQIEAPSCN